MDMAPLHLVVHTVVLLHLNQQQLQLHMVNLPQLLMATHHLQALMAAAVTTIINLHLKEMATNTADHLLQRTIMVHLVDHLQLDRMANPQLLFNSSMVMHRLQIPMALLQVVPRQQSLLNIELEEGLLFVMKLLARLSILMR